MKNNKAFTLIEIIITVMIVIVLMTISVPMYKNSKRDAVFVEGYTLLSAIRSAQEAYYSRYGNFVYWWHYRPTAWFTSNDELLGIDARGNKYFTYFAPTDTNARDNLKFFFNCYVVVPKKYQTGQINKLHLLYNLTTGQQTIDMVNHFANIA